jgi:hypothetical protein
VAVNKALGRIGLTILHGWEAATPRGISEGGSAVIPVHLLER